MLNGKTKTLTMDELPLSIEKCGTKLYTITEYHLMKTLNLNWVFCHGLVSGIYLGTPQSQNNTIRP